MRWIFVTLLILNATYFGWQQWALYSAKELPQDKTSPNERTASKKIPQLKMLSEGQGFAISTRSIQSVAKPMINEVVSETVIDQRRCPVIGPFEDNSVADSFLSKLTSRGIKGEVKELAVNEAADTWVIIPPLPTRREALQKLRELQAKGVDSYIITQGKLKNAISLGLFKEHDSAVSVQEQMSAQGYPVVLEQHMKQNNEYWLQMERNVLNKEAKAAVLNLLESQSTLKLTQSVCE